MADGRTIRCSCPIIFGNIYFLGNGNSFRVDFSDWGLGIHTDEMIGIDERNAKKMDGSEVDRIGVLPGSPESSKVLLNCIKMYIIYRCRCPRRHRS